MKRFILQVLYNMIGVEGELRLTQWWLTNFNKLPFWRIK